MGYNGLEALMKWWWETLRTVFSPVGAQIMTWLGTTMVMSSKILQGSIFLRKSLLFLKILIFILVWLAPFLITVTWSIFLCACARVEAEGLERVFKPISRIWYKEGLLEFLEAHVNREMCPLYLYQQGGCESRKPS